MALRKPTEAALNGDHTAYGLDKQRKHGGAGLKSFGGSVGGAEIEWDINEACTRDAVFKLRMGKETGYFSKEQIMRLMRWV